MEPWKPIEVPWKSHKEIPWKFHNAPWRPRDVSWRRPPAVPPDPFGCAAAAAPHGASPGARGAHWAPRRQRTMGPSWEVWGIDIIEDKYIYVFQIHFCIYIFILYIYMFFLFIYMFIPTALNIFWDCIWDGFWGPNTFTEGIWSTWV